jgi:ribonuclease BN (tRNA processing enzyme)
MRASRRRSGGPTEFVVWGCRGSRSLLPSRSAIGNSTSCYSLRRGSDLLVLDAGRGLAALSARLAGGAGGVRRVVVLVGHAHLDHWEGLKDAEWFWRKGNRLEVTILGPAEAIRTIRAALRHPSYVSLELLSVGTARRVRWGVLAPGRSRRLGPWRVRAVALRHYSGDHRRRFWLEALGFRVEAPDGATVAYVSDHEPTRATRSAERALIDGAHLAVYDAHFPNLDHQRHGHGSQEHAAAMARAHPGALVLAGHHGPTLSDAEIRAAHRRHGRGTPNFALAVEGARYRWDGRAFRRSAAARGGG